MLNCEHNPTLISGRGGSGGSSRVTVCTNCGEIRVAGEREGIHFSESFSLYGSHELLAASQAHRLMSMPDTTGPLVGKRTWKPLDFANERLYFVVRSWDIKDDKGQKNYKDSHVVAAQAPAHAAALVESTYKEQYDADERIVFHHSQVLPLNVLQPLAWTENGIQLLNVEFEEGMFVPGEWKCPKCQMRLGQRFISREDMSVGVNPDPEPPDCMNTCGVKMARVTWRDAAAEAGRIAEGWMKRARQLESDWPSDAAMPVDERDTAEPTEK